MAKTIQILAVLLFCLFIYGCKKTDSTQTPPPEKTPDPVPREIKQIEILSGNNQLGYKLEPLDTIVIKVKLNATTDNTPLPYYYKANNYSDRFYVYSQKKVGDDIIFKIIWQPSGLDAIPTIKFYVSANCTIDQLVKGACKNADSISITAGFRQPWKSVYTGAQNGYNVLNDLVFTDDIYRYKIKNLKDRSIILSGPLD